MPGREAINHCLKDGNSSCKLAASLRGGRRCPPALQSPAEAAKIPNSGGPSTVSGELSSGLGSVTDGFVAPGKSQPSFFPVCKMG